MAATIKQTATTSVGDDYLKLVRQFPLRPIRTMRDYDVAIRTRLGTLLSIAAPER